MFVLFLFIYFVAGPVQKKNLSIEFWFLVIFSSFQIEGDYKGGGGGGVSV